MAPMESVLLRGQCRFEFEGHEFVPEGETRSFENACWLQTSDAVKQRLAGLLSVDQFSLEFVGWIEMAFYGHLTSGGWNYGHFGMFSRQVTIDDVIEARITTPAVGTNGPPMSIRERIQKIKSDPEA